MGDTARLHLARKLFHASGVVIVAIYAGFGVSRAFAAWALGAVVAALLALDLARRAFPGLQQRFHAAFRTILDPKDDRGLNGSTLYFGGCALVVALFEREPACAGILALALGDSFAAIVGSSVRSPRWGRVSLAGSGACVVAAAAGALVFFPPPAALVAGLVAAALEAGSGSKLDNLTIPVGTALVLQSVFVPA